MTEISLVHSAGGIVAILVAHQLSWAYGAVAAVVAGYRLLAERERRKTLLELAVQAPAGTVVFVDKGPGGPAMWLKVGDERRRALWKGVRRG